MNKKGLIFLVLFIVSTLGVVGVSQASTNDKVEVTLQYVPPSYVPQGHVWVEIDKRFVSDNKVFGQNDKIYFAFYYDVAVVAWFGADAYGDGYQPTYWAFMTDENGSYTETRFAGVINVFLDQYDLGMSNFDISDPSGADTYQEIRIELEVGWHYLTVLAAELVSDENHTSFHWEYVKDSVYFYVGETDKTIPPLIENSEAVCNVEATAVKSEELTQHKYNWTDISVVRPVAEPGANANLDQQIALDGTANAPVIYNASWSDDIQLEVVDLGGGYYDIQYADIQHMGPGNFTWFANNGDLTFNTTGTLPLIKGQNYVYFLLVGSTIDDSATFYGLVYPSIAASSVTFMIYVGEKPPAAGVGPSFVAFISVSILSIAAVMIIRRRK